MAQLVEEKLQHLHDGAAAGEDEHLRALVGGVQEAFEAVPADELPQALAL